MKSSVLQQNKCIDRSAICMHEHITGYFCCRQMLLCTQGAQAQVAFDYC